MLDGGRRSGGGSRGARGPHVPPSAALLSLRRRGGGVGMCLGGVLVRAGLLLLLGGCTEWEPSGSSPVGQRQQAVVPPRFSDTRVARGLSAPTAMALAPDGRIFVCEQEGDLRVIQDGGLRSEPFLSLDVDAEGERGLLGVAVDPDFPAQPYVYVYYTATEPVVHNRLSRFTADGHSAVPDSELVLLELEPLGDVTRHHGGALHFGPDGKLYVAVGDSGRAAEAQTLDTLHGKLLRLNRDGTVPSDNPFGEGAIWALGLRNPSGLAVQPGTGRLFVNDVGQEAWEEINEAVAGGNYGWPVREGPSGDTRYRPPVYAYGHGSGDWNGCAISGGAFYNPPRSQFPEEYAGNYFFADSCNGWIRAWDPVSNAVTLFARGLGAVVDLDVGPDGALYYLDREREAVHRIHYREEGTAPVITTQPASRRVAPGLSATFTVSASGAGALSYQWQRDGMELPGETGATLTLKELEEEDSGAQVRVRVSNGSGSVLSEEALLTVRRDTPPFAELFAPPEGTRYRAGEVITFEGRGTDAEDGALPVTAFTWRVDFHHDDHLHPFLPSISGMARGTFTVPDTGETSANVWYRIHLRVADAGGNTHAVFRDVYPVKAKLRLETHPSGLEVTLEGQPQATPVEVQGVVGLRRALGVASPQMKDGVTYVFDHWSHGGARTQDLRTPATDTVYTAVFRPVPFPR